jgi:hypothetical protein
MSKVEPGQVWERLRDQGRVRIVKTHTTMSGLESAYLENVASGSRHWVWLISVPKRYRLVAPSPQRRDHDE